MTNANMWHGSHKTFPETIMMYVRVCVWQNRFICMCACVCDTTNPNVSRTALLYTWHAAFSCLSLSLSSIHMCDMTHHVVPTWAWHHTHVLCTRNITRSQIRDTASILSHQIFWGVTCITLCAHWEWAKMFFLVCVTWRIYAWHLDCERDNSLYSHNMSMTGYFFHTCGMKHFSYVWRDSFTRDAITINVRNHSKVRNHSIKSVTIWVRHDGLFICVIWRM